MKLLLLTLISILSMLFASLACLTPLFMFVAVCLWVFLYFDVIAFCKRFKHSPLLRQYIFNALSAAVKICHPRVYHLDCLCNGRYTGESKKKVLIHFIEHQQDSTKGNWESSGAIEHTK